MKNFLITTPIFYVNDIPHIGHAYTTIVADVFARYYKSIGDNVMFTTGTDEHGQKVARSAEACHSSCQEFVDKISDQFKMVSQELNSSHDEFVRTTQLRHRKSALGLWNELTKQGHIYKGRYTGWYSIRDEEFYSKDDLCDGCTPTGAPVELISEENYFFDLSKWQDKLLKFYISNPDFISPRSRYNEMLNFIKSGLKDLSVSRLRLDWGIKIPDDTNQTMYVWVDALSNYLTCCNYPDTTNDNYINFWKNGYKLHIIGKDILKFHAVYWPAFLMAANLPLPSKILAHGWWTNSGEKISKSLGNVINPLSLLKKINSDQLRYFLISGITLGQDGDYSYSALKKKINSDLVNNVCNLVQRVSVLAQKNFNGVLQDKQYNPISDKIIQFKEEFHSHMNNYEPHIALKVVMLLGSLGNEYINENTPWKNPQSDNAQDTLYIEATLIMEIAKMLSPFTPILSEKILRIFQFTQNRSIKISNFDGILMSRI